MEEITLWSYSAVLHKSFRVAQTIEVLFQLEQGCRQYTLAFHLF